MIIGIVICLTGLFLIIFEIHDYIANPYSPSLQFILGNMLFAFGASMGVAGFTVFLIGVLLKDGQPHTNIVNYQIRRCPNCGRPIPMDALICPYCTKKF
jgi:hypothetical protein